MRHCDTNFSHSGIADILRFLKVPDTATAARRPALSLRGLIHGPLKDSNFRRFLGYSFSMTFATGFIGQFVWLYLFDEVGMSNSRANLLLVSIPLAVGMISYPFWGRIVDRFGSKVALITAGSIAEWLGNDWRVTIFGRALTYHCVLFFCSAVLRIVAVGWLFTLKESGRNLATREAFRYMANNVYSNILQATFFPARVFARLAKASSKISRKKSS